MTLLFLALIGAAGVAGDMSAELKRLDDALGLDHIRLEGGELAISVSTNPGVDAALGLSVRRLIADDLVARGVSRPIELEPFATAESAIDAGAEWLLAVSVERRGRPLFVTARLIEIDRGVFAPAPDLGLALVKAEVEIDTELGSEPPVHDPPKGELRLDGPPVTLAVLDEPVLGLAACGPKDGPEILFVLTPTTLRAYAVSGKKLEPLSLERFELPPASQPSRELFGRVVCGESNAAGTSVAFGHSRAAVGAVARLDAKANAKKRLALELGHLPGMPLAYLGQSRFLLGAIDRGQGRFTSLAGIGRRPQDVQLQNLPASYFDLFAVTAEPETPKSYLALGAGHELVELDASFLNPVPRGKSGAGGTARAIDGARLVLRTGWSRAVEELSLVGAEARTVRLEGPVSAATFGRFDGGSILLLVAIKRGGGSTLATLRVARS